MTPSALTVRMLLGFAAAALSVAVFHQTVIFALSQLTGAQSVAWSTEPVGQFGVPAIVNNAFWGGLWGALFACIWQRVPGPSLPAKGAVFALLGPLLIGRWLVVPLIKSQPLFAGFDAVTMGSQVLIQIAFGAGLGWIYGLLAERRA